MRDAHRMKDKLDLSLDSRQIVSLLVAGMVVLGAVFVLGVVVGKKLSEADRAAQSGDLLTALDQKAAAMQKVNEEPPLTFQKTLTEKAAPEPPQPKPAVAVAAPPKPLEAKPAEAPKPAPAAEEPKPVVAEAAPAAPKGTVPQTPVATRTAPAEAREPARAKTVKLAVPPPRAPMPAAAPQTGWTLQLHASQEKADADRFAASMREKGYAPYLVAAEVAGRGTWHRVRLGSFPSKDAAAKYLVDFKRETGMDAFVAPAQ
jgi:cell division septation protein DedD